MFAAVGQEVAPMPVTSPQPPVLIQEEAVGQCCAPDQVCIGRAALAIGSGATILLGLGLFFTTLQLLRR